MLDPFGGPPGPYEQESAFSVFAGYLIFDAWIANTDRHAMNWAVLYGGDQLRLAASFDHGSALASGSTDERLAMTRVDEFCARGFAPRFEGGHRTTLVELARSAAALAGGDASHWFERMADVDERDVVNVVHAVVGLSEVRRTFLVDVLTLNRGRLLE